MDNLKKVRELIRKNGLDGFLVTNPTNIYYLTGFKGLLSADREAYLVLAKAPAFITARLYQSEAKAVRKNGLQIAIAKERNEMLKLAINKLQKCAKVGFEKNNLLFGEYEELKQGLLAKLTATENFIENLRVIKTEEEINKIEKAQIISQKAFKEILKTLKVGQTEAEIAHNLLSIIHSLGGEGLAFESIVASGPNSGRPHHKTGSRKISKGEILLLDFGARYQNYHADLSRTIFIGKANPEHKKIYHHVKNAQQKAIKKISHGIKSNMAFRAANDHFKGERLEKYFLHGLGHGIGLEIHEEPYLRPSRETTLQNNMVFSVEPGLYFPWGGVRIEDLVVIKNGRAKVLGKTQDKIIEV
ncbi:hypothetical protein A2870_01845 [Candidatus Curtissbacteria bacterium RIFCSPHIGHO2_01_FULL_41_11]|uniref:Xaa-Pro dipeptidase n=1 Tax=Candidatus Curtissbacteria bacterium RIFCSPHIGHO2_01_FULL_41_11 TaxID=1797711 RepID=A0A1F5G577_9BACT|nr:MAG: hypothetical protein A2870_01845 [Candidatus Curtissbacteria bacterium RIFCSPHIGHO2_01_FULL_41_11]